MTSVGQWLRHATAKLIDAGVDSARLDAELLLMHVWGVERIRLITDCKEDLPTIVEQAAERLLLRRCSREPMAYLTGIKEFWSREFEVGPEVLIPRPETEHLIENILDRFPDHEHPWNFADIGTGSGCIAVTLACEYPNALVSATDISSSALSVAHSNAERHGVASRISWHQGDLYAALAEITTSFDAIVSNPPYVSRNEFPNLDPELYFEPRAALTDDADGQSLLRLLVSEAPKRLVNGGYLLLETGSCGLPPAISNMVLETMIHDLSGLLRGGVYRHIS